MMDHSIWQSGPAYLALPRDCWPFSRDFLDVLPNSELRVPKAAFNVATIGPWKNLLGERLHHVITYIMDLSNCYSKTVHVTARVLMCYFDKSVDRIREPVTVLEIKAARKIQFIASMELTVKALSEGHLDPLRPVIDGGIVYVRGRCDKALINLLGIDRLPVFARESRLAALIMWEAHAEDHRTSPTNVLARSRQRAWIIRGRYLAKQVCKQCPLCRLNKKRLTQQLMSEIPTHQLYPCPPFSFVSLDFAGPYLAKAMGNSRASLKVWGLVLICQNTRAVKLYATAGYSTDDFFTAYVRFTSNHGNPLLVVSDSGSQLVKAGKVVDPSDPRSLDWNKIKEKVAKNGTDWKVIEPGCQWRNGLAEAAVKVLKSTLDLTLASQKTLNYAELDTLFSMIANTVNQRPIAARNFTDDDFEAITPNDLLLQRSRNTVPGIKFEEDESLTRRQVVMQEMEKMWWDMWIVQALPLLVPYKKWRLETRSVCVGDIVLVLFDRRIEKGEYRLARVLKVHPSRQGPTFVPDQAELKGTSPAQSNSQHVVRTVTVGMRQRDKREPALPYVYKPLQELTLGVQRIAVIFPIEEQQSGLNDGGSV